MDVDDDRWGKGKDTDGSANLMPRPPKTNKRIKENEEEEEEEEEERNRTT